MQIELKRLQHETGITFIFVTHDQEEALTMSDRIAVMNKGKILQVGSPREIYEKPSERFVANFIGETNFLLGKAVLTKNGKVNVQLAAGGGLALDAVEGVAIPGDVTVTVRPENAALVAVDHASIIATVAHVVYFGTDTHVHLVLQDGSTFIARKQNVGGQTLGVEVGQKIGIALAPHAASLIRD
jgi:spermidine/putrescine transport system ATP-binding protein